MATKKVVNMGQMPLSWSADTSFSASGYRRSAQHHNGAELVSILIIKWYSMASTQNGTIRMDFQSTGYLYKYPVTNIVFNEYTVYSNKAESNFFDEGLEEKLGGNKEVLGGE